MTRAPLIAATLSLLLATACTFGTHVEQPVKMEKVTLGDVRAYPEFNPTPLGQTTAHVIIAVPSGRDGGSLKVWSWEPNLSMLRWQNPPRHIQPKTWTVRGTPTFVDYTEDISPLSDRYTVKTELTRADGKVETSFQVFYVHDLDGLPDR